MMAWKTFRGLPLAVEQVLDCLRSYRAANPAALHASLRDRLARAVTDASTFVEYRRSSCGWAPEPEHVLWEDFNGRGFSGFGRLYLELAIAISRAREKGQDQPFDGLGKANGVGGYTDPEISCIAHMSSELQRIAVAVSDELETRQKHGELADGIPTYGLRWEEILAAPCKAPAPAGWEFAGEGLSRFALAGGGDAEDVLLAITLFRERDRGSQPASTEILLYPSLRSSFDFYTDYMSDRTPGWWTAMDRAAAYIASIIDANVRTGQRPEYQALAGRLIARWDLGAQFRQARGDGGMNLTLVDGNSHYGAFATAIGQAAGHAVAHLQFRGDTPAAETSVPADVT